MLLLLLLALPVHAEWEGPSISLAGFTSIQQSTQDLHWEMAEVWYRRCFALAKSRGDRSLATKALNNVGAIRLQHDDLVVAEAAFLQALRINPADLDAAANLAGTYLYQAQAGAPGRREKAIEIYEVILMARPNFAQAWCNLGVAYAAGGEMDRARECYLTASRLDPRNEVYKDNLRRTQ